uniref:Uncharacterized protein n=1 Tax=Sphaeramia orbicularis TaxID=375764 RepID=A0A672Y6D0_9TELE
YIPPAHCHFFTAAKVGGCTSLISTIISSLYDFQQREMITLFTKRLKIHFLKLITMLEHLQTSKLLLFGPRHNILPSQTPKPHQQILQQKIFFFKKIPHLQKQLVPPYCYKTLHSETHHSSFQIS